MSQSKISRIESGKVLPSIVDVQRILAALGVANDAAKPFLDLARVANVHYRSVRSLAEMGIWRGQEELGALVESASTIRYFTPAAPSGLLQTADYARAILTPTISGRPARNVDRAVEARLKRQQALHDRSRRFIFIMTEQTVRWRQAPAEVMSAQCHHMAELAELPNVTIAVVPNDAEMDCGVPLNSFTAYDERFVLVELFSGEMMLRDPRDVEYHLNIMNHFLERALVGAEVTALLRRIEF